MEKEERFTFRASTDDREAIVMLAKHLQRSQSDAVRFVVRQAAEQAQAQDKPTTNR